MERRGSRSTVTREGKKSLCVFLVRVILISFEKKRKNVRTLQLSFGALSEPLLHRLDIFSDPIDTTNTLILFTTPCNELRIRIQTQISMSSEGPMRFCFARCRCGGPFRALSLPPRLARGFEMLTPKCCRRFLVCRNTAKSQTTQQEIQETRQNHKKHTTKHTHTFRAQKLTLTPLKIFKIN